MDPQPSLWSLMAYGDNGYGDEFVRGILFTLQISVCGYIVAFILGTVIEKTIGFRAKEEDEVAGLDLVLHGEGYAI